EVVGGNACSGDPLASSVRRRACDTGSYVADATSKSVVVDACVIRIRKRFSKLGLRREMSAGSTLGRPSKTSGRSSAGSAYGIPPEVGSTSVPLRIGDSSATMAVSPLPVVEMTPAVVPPKMKRTGPGTVLLASEVTLAAPSGIHFERAWLRRPKIGSIWFQSSGLLIV